MGLVLLGWTLASAGINCRAQALQADPIDGDFSPRGGLGLVGYCDALAATPWPRSAPARRALLQRFEALRQPCLRHAGFLASLGALWLEEGEPGQALLWLERSLMIDPTLLGTQADHALALAALGETAARDNLVREWQGRTDVPPALRQRLAMGPEPVNGARKNGAGAPALHAVRPPDGWVTYREASVWAGYESNLDHSPRLSELTITPPDGAQKLPLATPLKPRSGAATLGELSLQLARSPAAGSVIQTGLQASARYAPSDAPTDWHHVQWAASAAQRWGAWRAQVLANATWIGGALNEPYRLTRLGLSVDREAVGCSHRLTLEAEHRVQRTTSSADGKSAGALWNSLCPWQGLGREWAIGIAGRLSVDRPTDPNRPGGEQRQSSLGIRVLGVVGPGLRLDANVRGIRLKDSEGYSPLLENDAIRHLHQVQLTVELSKSLAWSWLPGAEALVQLQGVRQTSNLSLFRYEGLSAYTGVRWRW